MSLWEKLNAPLEIRERLSSLAGRARALAAPGAAAAARNAGRLATRRDVLAAAAATGLATALYGLGRQWPRMHDFGETAILYLIDTCRADIINMRINGEEVSPHLNRAAREGMYFPRAYSTSNHTKTGVAGILTGAQPHVHGIFWYANALPPMVTLASGFREKDCRALAVVNNQWVEPEPGRASARHEAGFAQGFDDYLTYGMRMIRVTDAGRETRPRVYKPDAEMRQALFAALGPALKDAEARFPMFLWHHSMTLHWPCMTDRPNPFAGRFRSLAGADPHALWLDDWAFVNSFWKRGDNPNPRSFGRLTDEEKTRVRMMYYEAAAYADYEFGEFMNELRRHKSDRVSLVITADHGESLGEHGEFGHGQGMGEAAIRVPLIFWGRDFPRATVPYRVSNAAILDTLFAYAGIRRINGDLLDPRTIAGDRPIMAAARDLRAYVNREGLKVVKNGNGGAVFYDLNADPDERRELSLTPSKRAEALQELEQYEAMQDRIRQERGIRHELTGIEWQLNISELSPEEREKAKKRSRKRPAEENREMMEQMRAVGYLNG